MLSALLREWRLIGSWSLTSNLRQLPMSEVPKAAPKKPGDIGQPAGCITLDELLQWRDLVSAPGSLAGSRASKT